MQKHMGLVQIFKQPNNRTELSFLGHALQENNYCISIKQCFFIQWEEFMKVGKDVTDQQLQERINLARPNKCCTLIYTVSHDIIVYFL